MPSLRETDLYPPVKKLLESQGYAVKGEVGAADLVAVRDDEDPVIVELKTGFSLTLIHQAIDRQKMTDAVYVAVPSGGTRAFWKSLRSNKALCRRLGLGLMIVRLPDGTVDILCDPAPYAPRQSKPRKGRLLKEFAHRVGDPNTGGSTRQPLMTAYRQDALRCVIVLSDRKAAKASDVAAAAGVSRARRIMADDHYGWFERVRTGIYTLSPKGQQVVAEFAVQIAQLRAALADSGTVSSPDGDTIAA